MSNGFIQKSPTVICVPNQPSPVHRSLQTGSRPLSSGRSPDQPSESGKYPNTTRAELAALHKLIRPAPSFRAKRGISIHTSFRRRREACAIASNSVFKEPALRSRRSLKNKLPGDKRRAHLPIHCPWQNCSKLIGFLPGIRSYFLASLDPEVCSLRSGQPKGSPSTVQSHSNLPEGWDSTLGKFGNAHRPPLTASPLPYCLTQGAGNQGLYGTTPHSSSPSRKQISITLCNCGNLPSLQNQLSFR